MKDLETSKLGGSGFGIYGATTKPHDGDIQRDNTRIFRNMHDWSKFVATYGLFDIMAQVCKEAEDLTGRPGSCDADVRFLEAHLLLQNRESECGTSFSVHQDDHDGVGSPGLTIVLCLFAQGAPTAVEVLGDNVNGASVRGEFKRAGSFALFPSLLWHRSVPPKPDAGDYCAVKVSIFFSMPKRNTRKRRSCGL
jgi:hypothetical protein